MGGEPEDRFFFGATTPLFASENLSIKNPERNAYLDGKGIVLAKRLAGIRAKSRNMPDFLDLK